MARDLAERAIDAAIKARPQVVKKKRPGLVSVLLALFNRSNRNRHNECSPGYRTIGRFAGLEKRAVGRAVRELARLGLITRVYLPSVRDRIGRKMTPCYRVHLSPLRLVADPVATAIAELVPLAPPGPVSFPEVAPVVPVALADVAALAAVDQLAPVGAATVAPPPPRVPPEEDKRSPKVIGSGPLRERPWDPESESVRARAHAFNRTRPDDPPGECWLPGGGPPRGLPPATATARSVVLPRSAEAARGGGLPPAPPGPVLPGFSPSESASVLASQAKLLAQREALRRAAVPPEVKSPDDPKAPVPPWAAIAARLQQLTKKKDDQ